jgi:hypothetical protein
LLEQVLARCGPSHFGAAVQEAETAQAERLVVEGLKRMRWGEADLTTTTITARTAIHNQTTFVLRRMAKSTWI